MSVPKVRGCRVGWIGHSHWKRGISYLFISHMASRAVSKTGFLIQPVLSNILRWSSINYNRVPQWIWILHDSWRRLWSSSRFLICLTLEALMRLEAFKLGCRILRDPNVALQEAPAGPVLFYHGPVACLERFSRDMEVNSPTKRQSTVHGSMFFSWWCLIFCRFPKFTCFFAGCVRKNPSKSHPTASTGLPSLQGFVWDHIDSYRIIISHPIEHK